MDFPSFLPKHHAPLPQSHPLSIHLKEQHETQRPKCDGCLNPKSFSRSKARHPVNLDIRRHETCPIATGRDPCADLSRSFGVAVQQVSIDGCRDDHGTDTLNRRKHSNYHIVPVLLEGESQDSQTRTADEGCRVGYNQSSFGVKTASVPLSVVSSNGIMQKVARKPSDQAANKTKEVEKTCSIVSSKVFEEQLGPAEMETHQFPALRTDKSWSTRYQW